MAETQVCAASDVPENGVISREVGDELVAIYNIDGTYYAIGNACAHADGPLGEGTVEGCVVTCPDHGWQYDLRDGKCRTNPQARVPTYPVQIVGDAVCVRI